MISKPKNIHIYTDSQSIIDKQDAITEYPTAKNKMTMHSEYDALLALHPALETYPNRPITEWVESHKGDDEQEKDLKLDALLDVEADALAAEGLKFDFLKQKVSMDPKLCVQLHIDNTTMSRDLKQTILRVTKTETSMRYYMDRFKRDNNTCEQFDWEIFRWAYKTRIKKKFEWTNKYYLKHLPTGEQMQKHGGLEDEQCCSCGAPIETDDHLLQ